MSLQHFSFVTNVETIRGDILLSWHLLKKKNPDDSHSEILKNCQYYHANIAENVQLLLALVKMGHSDHYEVFVPLYQRPIEISNI